MRKYEIYDGKQFVLVVFRMMEVDKMGRKKREKEK